MHHITRRRSSSRFRSPRRRTLAVAALAGAAALALGGNAVADIVVGESPPSEGHTRQYWTIEAKHSGLLLDVSGASTQNGAQIGQWMSPGAMNEQWETVGYQQATNSNLIRNRWSRQCLTSPSNAEGATIVQRPCDGNSHQRWKFDAWKDSPPGYYRNITNVANQFDLNIAGGSGDYGAPLIQYRHVRAAPNALFALGDGRYVKD